jgi:twitching motility protein PilT
MPLRSLLTAAVEGGASDLHLKAGSAPMLRVRGTLVPIPGGEPLDHSDLRAIADRVIPPAQRAVFSERHDVDFAYSAQDLGRFRCNAFKQRGAIGLIFRVVPMHIPSIDELRLPTALTAIAREERGLVLVTGTTGSGKSTTLAALIDQVNDSRTAHVMTIEDPIEFLHTDKRSIVNQRELGTDTLTFSGALRSALRQDPDVIMVGEMRDHHTIETALLAAETGHLVFSTLHTVDATETINRIIATFPPHQQPQIRLQLGSVLKAVISQRLVPTVDGLSRVPAVEILVGTPLVRSCIVDGERTHLIPDAIAQGTSQYGMQTFDQSLLGLHRDGLVTFEEALHWATDVDDFTLRARGIVSGTEAPQAKAQDTEITRFGA